MNNIDYIENNYIEKTVLCTQLHLTPDELLAMIDNHLIPAPAYEVLHHYTISSPLGDACTEMVKKQYFPKSTIGLIQNQHNQNKQKFKDKLLQALKRHPYQSLAHEGIIDNKGTINKTIFERYTEERWAFYIRGVYGICTHHASAEEIVRKGIVVARLQQYAQANGSDLPLLEALNQEYNEVATDFAPYQRAQSSRGKYLDPLLQKHNRHKLIKNYNSL